MRRLLLLLLLVPLLGADDSCQVAQQAVQRADLTLAGKQARECVEATKSLPAYLLLCGILQKSGQTEDLYQASAEAMRLFPQEPRFYLAAGTYEARQQHYEKAIATFKAAHERWPRDAKFQSLLASAYFAEGARLLNSGDSEGAIQHLRRSTELAPGDAVAWLDLGRALHNLLRYTEALAAFDRVVKLAPETPLAFFHRGLSYHTLGRFKEAIADLDRQIEKAPEYPPAYLVRGLSHLALGDWAAALPDLDIAVDRMPQDAKAHYAKGRALMQAGRLQEARDSIQKAVDLDSSDPAPANTLATISALLDKAKSPERGERADTRMMASSAMPVFEDVAPSAGIDIHIVSGGEKDKPYLLESVGGGLAVIDFDNDGFMDLYVVNGSTIDAMKAGKPIYPNALYHNLGNGKFRNVTEAAGVTGKAWGKGALAFDFDNDGWQDLYVVNYGSNLLYRNKGDNTFEDVTGRAGVADARWSSAAAAADYDKDGDLDLFVVNYLDYPLDRLPEKGQFCSYQNMPVACGPRGLKGAGDTLYRNNGDGTFTDISRQAGVADTEGYYGLAAAWGDYDNDGDLDLFVANDNTPNRLYQNQGNGKFVDVALEAGVAYSQDGRDQSCMGVEFEDLDNDGWLDLLVTNFSEDYNTLYRNTGGGFFSDESHRMGLVSDSWGDLSWGAGFYDFNNDGWKDVFIANGHIYPTVDQAPLDLSYKQANKLYLNSGGNLVNGNAKAGPGLAARKSYRGAAFADFNNDGWIDIAVSALDDAPSLLINQGLPGQHWLLIKLEGFSIGARVTLKAGGMVQTREMKAGGSFASTNDPRPHFGLGSINEVDELEVRWPSGKITRLTGLTANQILTVRE